MLGVGGSLDASGDSWWPPTCASSSHLVQRIQIHENGWQRKRGGRPRCKMTPSNGSRCVGKGAQVACKAVAPGQCIHLLVKWWVPQELLCLWLPCHAPSSSHTLSSLLPLPPPPSLLASEGGQVGLPARSGCYISLEFLATSSPELPVLGWVAGTDRTSKVNIGHPFH